VALCAGCNPADEIATGPAGASANPLPPALAAPDAPLAANGQGSARRTNAAGPAANDPKEAAVPPSAIQFGVPGAAALPKETTAPGGANPASAAARAGAPAATSPSDRNHRALRSVLINNVPHVRQRPDFCGEACAAMYLNYLGTDYDQDDVFDISGLDPVLGRGCYTKELAEALKRTGIDPGPVWHSIEASQAGEQLAGQFRALLDDLEVGVPSIVCTHYDDLPGTTEHFRLVLGYDAQADQVIYHEPAEAAGAYRRMGRDEFLRLWPLKYDARRWTVIRLRLEAGTLAEPPAAGSLTNADYAQHVMKLKRKIPSDDFHIVLCKPFVVVGDEPPEKVRQRAESTVRWAVERLKRQYFEKDPDDILDIWLFKDKDSYDRHTREVFHDRPTTPFGYYSSAHKALIMNIATGGGTLVHEIVHPFMAANFPACPSWFNEGLASLYEQSGERQGQIVGYTNWRLRGLQEAIRNGPIPSFADLCSTTTHQFYREDPGTNYAQARYLCYYLQERGLLLRYYQEFRRAAEADATGYATLSKVLGRTDMEEFQKEWEQFVLKLRF
jgi:hypothetical protein